MALSAIRPAFGRGPRFAPGYFVDTLEIGFHPVPGSAKT